MWSARTELLIGKNNCEKLAKGHVTVVGVGGVGGYVAVLLARAGIGNLTLIDFDKVDETNINRQVVANKFSIGKLKTEVLKEMIKSINPNCNIRTFSERLTEENIKNMIQIEDNYVVDCIDSVKDKVALCEYCYFNKIKIVSAMGAGNRFDIPNFYVTDIYKTSNDGLAKVMRKALKEKGVKNLDVVTSKSVAVKTNTKEIGSISYYPCASACVITGFVVNNLIKNIN